MGGHGETVKLDKNICDTLSRLQTRSRLREIANRRRQASNNNDGEHPLLDQDIIIHDQGTSATAILETYPPETKQTNATNDTYKPTATKKATKKGGVSEDVDGQGPDPTDPNGNSSDNNCRGGKFHLSTLGQRQLDEENPTFATTPLIPQPKTTMGTK